MKLYDKGVWLLDGKVVTDQSNRNINEDRKKTIAWEILANHVVKEEEGQLHLRFDSLTSHDITYVGIIQTARASV